MAIELVSLLWMAIEAVVAIGSGVSVHSLSLTAFGIDSLIELAAGGVLLWRLDIERRKASPSRVEAAEKRACWVVGSALLALAGYIVILGTYELLAHQGSEASAWGLGLTLASSLIMPYLAHSKQRIGAQVGSTALKSDGSCSMVCAYMAWTVVLGIVLQVLLGWWWLSAIAALALVYFVVKEGLEALNKARGLTDACDC